MKRNKKLNKKFKKIILPTIIFLIFSATIILFLNTPIQNITKLENVSMCEKEDKIESYRIYNISYEITFTYNLKNELGIKNVRLINMIHHPTLVQPTDAFILKLIDFKNRELYKENFSITVIPLYALDPRWFDENGNRIYYPNQTLPTSTTVIMWIPYFTNAMKIDIYDKNQKLVLSYDVSKFSICNMNNICDNEESCDTCPSDCKFTSKKS
ncbi:MAG: hypothetical protein KQA40_03280 [Candidatus Aenigmarchaeota archaeon]|nr:hypothetical protein [Candidatus Aenigmarchaeota archaeon]